MHIGLIFVIVLGIVGCDYYDDRLVIRNDSAYNIYVRVENDTLLTVPEGNEEIGYLMPENFVKSNEELTMVLPGSKIAWEFQALKSTDSLLHLFVFSEDVLQKYNWREVKEYRLYEKRYDYSINQLKKMEWKIIHK